MKLTIATFMSALLLVSVKANALVTPGTHQLGLQVGASNPVSYNDVNGTRSEFGEVGGALGINYLYQIRPNFSLGGDLNFKNFGDKDINTGVGPATIDSSAWTLLAIGRADLLPEGDIRPYGLLGLGLGGVKREVDFVNSNFDREQRSGGFAMALAAGVDFDINPTWVAGAELRWNYINTSENEVGTSSVRTVDMLFKVGYKF